VGILQTDLVTDVIKLYKACTDVITLYSVIYNTDSTLYTVMSA